jgi:hypothetical protein
MENVNFAGPEDDEELEETAAEETAEDASDETPEENA